MNLMNECGFVNVKVESYILFSPFIVYLSNELSNRLYEIEDKYIKKWGYLLIATGEIDCK